MKQTTNYNLVKPELTDSPPDITVMNSNWDKIDVKLKANEEQIENLGVNKADLIDGKVPSRQLPSINYLSPTGDGKDLTVNFTEVGIRANIATGEKLAVLFGKIKKYFTDLKIVAFTGSYTDLSDKPESLPANGGISAACSGNSATATKLTTARPINGVNFDGTQGITITDSTKLPLTGGTMTGILYAQSNTSYTTRQVRNIVQSTASPSGGSNGDVWHMYA